MAAAAAPALDELAELNKSLERALESAAAVLEALSRGDEAAIGDVNSHTDVFVQSVHTVRAGIQRHATLMDAVEPSRSGDIAAYREALAPARARLYLANMRARAAAHDLRQLRPQST